MWPVLKLIALLMVVSPLAHAELIVEDVSEATTCSDFGMVLHPNGRYCIKPELLKAPASKPCHDDSVEVQQ